MDTVDLAWAQSNSPARLSLEAELGTLLFHHAPAKPSRPPRATPWSRTPEQSSMKL